MDFDPTKLHPLPNAQELRRPPGTINIAWDPNNGAFGSKFNGVNAVEAIGCAVWFILETWFAKSGRQVETKVSLHGPDEVPPPRN